MVQWVLIIWYVDGNLIEIGIDNNCILRTIRNLLEKQTPQITIQNNKPQISFFKNVNLTLSIDK